MTEASKSRESLLWGWMTGFLEVRGSVFDGCRRKDSPMTESASPRAQDAGIPTTPFHAMLGLESPLHRHDVAQTGNGFPDSRQLHLSLPRLSL